MNEINSNENFDVTQSSELINIIRDNINSVLIGQQSVIDSVLVALLAGGHVLIEGVPGLGKTLLVRALASSFSGNYKRIQFTPDLMPTDVTGHSIYNLNEGKFHIRRGPVFTNLLLADEINRSPAKTQAALLEVMQEKQVTIEGSRLPVELPFMVLATQNPIEQEGTYPLPEAELDRFLLKAQIDYPDHDDEMQLTRKVTDNNIDDSLFVEPTKRAINAEDILRLQKVTSSIEIDDKVLDYAVRLVRATRESTALFKGAGPRACISLVRAARANALMRGESFVIPDDVKAMAIPVMRHRVILSTEMDIEGQMVDQILNQIIDSVQAPRA